MANEIIKTSDNIEDLLDKVSGLIEQARTYVKTSVNTAEVYTKYYIGKYIVEYEQKGNVRAQYGEQLLKDLSKKTDFTLWCRLVIHEFEVHKEVLYCLFKKVNHWLSF